MKSISTLMEALRKLLINGSDGYAIGDFPTPISRPGTRAKDQPTE